MPFRDVDDECRLIGKMLNVLLPPHANHTLNRAHPRLGVNRWQGEYM